MPVKANQALELLAAFAEAGITVWVDGGWGVDALISRQSREHADLDLVLPRNDVGPTTKLLEVAGFAVTRDWLPTAIAFAHNDGREVDLHPVDPTPDGGGDQLLPDGTRWHYEPPVPGTIAGRAVLCVSLATQLASHAGYEPDAGDIADMRLLASTFGFELPPPYDVLCASRR